MSVLEIIEKPDPRLYQISRTIDKLDKGIIDLAVDMVETLKDKKGIGLAAPQVGHNIRMIVAADPSDGKFVVIVNPVIKYKKGKTKWKEQCLSVPNKKAVVERFKRIKIQGMFLHPAPRITTIKASGAFAAVLQHEIDHLDGKLI